MEEAFKKGVALETRGNFPGIVKGGAVSLRLTSFHGAKKARTATERFSILSYSDEFSLTFLYRLDTERGKSRKNGKTTPDMYETACEKNIRFHITTEKIHFPSESGEGKRIRRKLRERMRYAPASFRSSAFYLGKTLFPTFPLGLRLTARDSRHRKKGEWRR